VISVIFITACIEEISNSKDDIEYYKTKADTLENYYTGSFELIKTTKNETLLVTKLGENTYYVGELKKSAKGFYTAKISASVRMETGASWELITIDGNEYTIFFEKTSKGPIFIPLSSNDYYVSIVEGHKLGENPLTLTNAIQDFETIKNK
jgi:hypothetical protein